VKADGADLIPDSIHRMELAGIGQMQARFHGASDLGLHFSFAEMAPEVEDSLSRKLQDAQKQDQRFITAAMEAAERIQAAIAQAVSRGTIAADDLFDAEYREIPGTNPTQYTTRFLPLLESILPEYQEPVLALDSRVVFCAAVDRNGYLPVHNRKYSAPQRPDDVVWNTANCRNKRIFSDRAGLLAARNTRPFLLQAYARDMGGGQKVMLKEVDAAIRVNNLPWGGVRLAYKY
jgi:methyl-accepting chemotaxis protein